MSAEQDLLKSLLPAIRERIESDYERYAPLLALLGAWKQEVEGHVTQIERHVVTQLMQELFPKGAWRFPAQTLAIPEDMVRRDVSEEMLFTDRTSQMVWTPCGPGWTLPTRLSDWRVERQGWDRHALVCDIQMENRQPDARLLSAEEDHFKGQLAFVSARESVVAELATMPWAVQHPGENFQPVGVSRYQGYLDFEKGLGAARRKQRQLEAWLPAFYPYSRKFLRFYTPGPEDAALVAAFAPEAWNWLGSGARTIRLAALISEEVADVLQAARELPPLILNAIPVAQMRTGGEPLTENPDRVGDSYKVPFMSVRNCFAASAREYRAANEGVHTTYYAPRMLSTRSEDLRGRTDLQDISVLCERPAQEGTEYRVRIYYDCYGEQAAAPTFLTRPPGLRYTTPLPPLGSMNAPIVDYEDPGAKHSWYHTLLRAPQLTQGDVLEILTQVPDCRTWLDLDPDYVSIQLDVENTPWIERAPWNNHLWPTLVSEAALLEQRATFLTKSKVAIIPVMRLLFQRGKPGLPDFLQEDLAHYAASLISRYFMLGWYRVVGQMQGR